MDRLIEWLKSEVAPVWTPGDGGDTGSRLPGRWFACLTGLVSLVALAGPPFLVRDDAAALPEELPPLVEPATMFTATMLVVPIVFWFVHVPLGKVIGSWEWEAHRAPAERYNRTILLAAGMFLAILVWLTVSADMTYAGRVFVFVSLFGAALWGAVIAMRNERKDRDLDDRWPRAASSRRPWCAAPWPASTGASPPGGASCPVNRRTRPPGCSGSSPVPP